MKLQAKKKDVETKVAEKTTKKKEKPNLALVLSKEDYQKLAQEYTDVSKEAKALTDRKNELSIQLKEGAEKYGTKDDKGSYYMGDEKDKFIIGKVHKVSLHINSEKAMSILKSKGLKECFTTVVRTEYVIDESAVEKAVSEGKLTLDEAQSMYDSSESWQVSVKERVVEAEMPEIEQTTLKSAAKRKR